MNGFWHQNNGINNLEIPPPQSKTINCCTILGVSVWPRRKVIKEVVAQYFKEANEKYEACVNTLSTNWKYAVNFVTAHIDLRINHSETVKLQTQINIWHQM